MDAFYASIEQRDDPSLRGKPVIVGASSARGVVAAASYEARTFGIRSAMPGFRARELCPHGVFLPSRIEHYAAVSEDVHGVFREITPEIEPIALDEAFLDVTGSVGLFGGPLEVARRLKRRVREVTGLAVSCGVAPVKMVAKLACTLGKPDGLLVVPADAVRWLLDPLPVRRLWGVGPVAERSLVAKGFRTLGDLANADERRLIALLGARGPELARLARGEDERAVVRDGAPKSIGEENTFETDVLDRDFVASALTAHSEAVARRARHAGYRGRTVTLKMKLGAPRGRRASRVAEGDEPVYPLLTRARTLREATNDGKRIRDVAVELWDQAALAEPVRLLGVTLSNLERTDAEQLELFGRARPAGALGRALDAITDRFGKRAIGRAVQEPEKATHTHQKKRGDG